MPVRRQSVWLAMWRQGRRWWCRWNGRPPVSEWKVIGSGSSYDRVDDYHLIVEAVEAWDGWETVSGLASKMLRTYGGNVPRWRSRIRELCRGTSPALRLAPLAPEQITPRTRRAKVKRLHRIPGVSVADAVRGAVPPKAAPQLAPRARVARVTPLAATAPPDAELPADPPAPRVRINVHTGEPAPTRAIAPSRARDAAAREITDAEWWAMTPAEQRYWDYDRARRQARRSGTYGEVLPGANRQGIRTTRRDGSPPANHAPRMFG